MRSFKFATAVAAGLSLAPVAAHAYSAFYVFGDSLSDVGNLYAAIGLPASPYANGQFSNGPIWVRDLANELQLGPITPSSLGGTDYAYGYATTGYVVTPVPSVQSQISGIFLPTHGGSAPSSALYSVWAGANDLFQIASGVSTPADLPAAEAQAAAAAAVQAQNVKALVDAGARNILVPLVPDLGKTPTFNGSLLTAGVGTALSSAFNAALVDGLKLLNGTPGLSLSILDTFAAIDDIVQNPGKYGLTDVSGRCYEAPPQDYSGGGTVCADPASYLFWDWVHPTAAGHALIADAAFALVPEPGSIAVFATGLTVFCTLRRRRAANAVTPARA